MTAVAGNKAPDLMWWAPAYTGQLAKTGKLVKVQDMIKADKSFNKSDIYIPAFIRAYPFLNVEVKFQ